MRTVIIQWRTDTDAKYYFFDENSDGASWQPLWPRLLVKSGQHAEQAAGRTVR
jgi:hypothetical protein